MKKSSDSSARVVGASRECNIGGPDELHPFTKNSETGVTLKPESAFLLDGVR